MATPLRQMQQQHQHLSWPRPARTTRLPSRPSICNRTAPIPSPTHHSPPERGRLWPPRPAAGRALADGDHEPVMRKAVPLNIK